MSDNIVKFPTNLTRKTRPANTNNSAEDSKRIKENKTIFIDKLTDHYGIQLINKLAMHGFDIDNDKFMCDYIFTMETLRACLLRNVGVTHPLQKLSDKSEDLIADNDVDFNDDE
jgi:hypothetical protein